jgi:acid stress-induced BolA-like protein IbaG/YrbA
MMNKSVDERGGEPAVVDHRVPLSELKVRGDGHASALIAAGDYLEQKLSCVTA